MNKKTILINISNIHGGGALQVAISFVSELLIFEQVNSGIKILVSSEVVEGLDQASFKSTLWDIEVFNTYGIKTLWSKLNWVQTDFEVIFTLFGPKYTLFKAKKDILGFAQPWILNFNNPITSNLPFVEKNKLRLKFGLQKWFFKRANHIVVELEHVKKSLAEQKIFIENHVSVVHNTLSNLYLTPDLWQEVVVKRKKDEIAIGFVTRDYLHKNIQILPIVAKILRDKYRLSVKFYLSLTDVEWRNYSESFGAYGETVGSLNVYQCPSFYLQMDAVVFPSLLECFSATPLEALAMKKPLFASDKGFVRDVCQEHAIYFDPFDAEDIAKLIADYFQGEQKTDEQLEVARNHVLAFSNAKQRAEDYLKIIKQHLGN